MNSHVPLQTGRTYERLAANLTRETARVLVPLRVNFQVVVVSKSLAAHVARVRLRVAVRQHVSPQISAEVEPLAARCALVPPFAAVDEHVRPQVAETRARLVALRTLVRLPGVVHHVKLEIAHRSEVLRALRTPVGLLRRVASPQVRVQIARTVALVWTQVAAERLRFHVTPNVLLEVRGRFERLAAQRTLVRLLAQVNVDVLLECGHAGELAGALDALIEETCHSDAFLAARTLNWLGAADLGHLQLASAVYRRVSFEILLVDETFATTAARITDDT